MLRRCLLALLLLAGCALLTVRAVPARAQTVTGDQLSGLLLNTDDLPGWTMVSDTTLPNLGPLVEAVRSFADGNQNIAGVGLLAYQDGRALSDADLAMLQDGSFLQQSANGFARPLGTLSDFQTVGAQGVGDQDQAATFTVTGSNATLQVAIDVFARGNYIGFAIAAMPSDSADDATAQLPQVTQIAQQQDAKLQAAMP